MAPRMVLMCGLAGSGKSTYARGLEREGWVRLSIDREAWAAGHTVHPLPAEVRDAIVVRQQAELLRALTSGRDVVVDYAFWSRAMRDEYRQLGRAAGARVEVIYLEVPHDELLRRLERRAAGERGPDSVVVPPDLLTRYVAGFEAPDPDETDVRVVRA